MRTVPLIKQIDRAVRREYHEPPVLHPVGVHTGVIAEWGEIKQSLSGSLFHCAAKVTTDAGSVWCTVAATPNTLVLLRSLMPVGSSHTVEVEHRVFYGRPLASGYFVVETDRGGL